MIGVAFSKRLQTSHVPDKVSDLRFRERELFQQPHQTNSVDCFPLRILSPRNVECRRRAMYYYMEAFKKVDVIVTPTTA